MCIVYLCASCIIVSPFPPVGTTQICTCIILLFVRNIYVYDLCWNGLPTFNKPTTVIPSGLRIEARAPLESRASYLTCHFIWLLQFASEASWLFICRPIAHIYIHNLISDPDWCYCNVSTYPLCSDTCRGGDHSSLIIWQIPTHVDVETVFFSYYFCNM